MRAISVVASAILLAGGAVWWETSRPTIEQTTIPLSYKEAQGKCPIPLPTEAKNIQYAYYSDVTVHQCFVRFEVPYEIGISHIDAVFREHAKRMKWSFTNPSATAITEPPRRSLMPLPALRIDWFDIERIRHGKTYGELNSWQPQVWIDADRNLFFFCLTD